MKALSSSLKKVLTLLLVIVLSFSAFACKDKKPNSTGDSSSSSSTPAPVFPVTITVSASSDTIKVGEEVTLTVTVSNADDTTYTWSVDEAGSALVQIADNVLTIRDDAEINIDTIVVLTATANADSKAKASKSIKVIAPVVDGRVGELTSEMIAAIGNPSITVTGTLTDVYFNNYYPQYNGETIYDMTVEMEEGKWRGVWNAREEGAAGRIEDNYRKGAKDGVKDYNGNVGHALEKLHIDKNNQVVSSTVTDYMSIPAIWESQHLWNHLANLNVNKFTYDIENDLYVYTVDDKDMDSLYLMTYLSYSLTPMLADTLVQIAFTVENGAITSLKGMTERVYEGLDEQTGEFDAYSDTIIEVTFSNIGTTTVGDPTPYDAPEFANVLNEVLGEMQNTKNYTYKTVDKTISAPSGSGDDYELSVGAVDSTTYGVPGANTSTGTVGTVGYVTEDKILLHETGKYSYGMDDKLFYHSYSGYVQNSDNTYDYFESSGSTLVGKRKYTGNMFDAMPGFDFSANVFTFEGTEIQIIANHSTPVYKFVLRETAISRDVAMEINLDGKDSKASVVADLVIWIADFGGDYQLYKTQIPYDLVSGTYIGTYETTYMSFGNTQIPEEYFEGYVPRVIPTSWDQTLTKYYQVNFEGKSYDENTQTVIDATYGDAGKDIPSPAVFFAMFGDNMNGPFYDWKETSDVDASGNPIKKGWISINLSLDDSLVDENTRIKDFDAVVAKIDEVMANNGYTKSLQNSDITGGESGHASRWLTYTKGDIMVVMENNQTRFFFIDFYPIGMWSLNR